MEKDFVQKRWIDKTIEEWHSRQDYLKNVLKRKIHKNEIMTEKEKEEFCSKLDRVGKDYLFHADTYISQLGNCYSKRESLNGLIDSSLHEKQVAWANHLSDIAYEINKLYGDWMRDPMLDFEPVEFDGDIIITDPYRIIEDKHKEKVLDTESDWTASEYGEKMDAFGMRTYMTGSTFRIGWCHGVFDKRVKQPIGYFGNDTSMTGVFLLSEVLKYNPDFNRHVENPWGTAWIKDFKGKVWFRVVKVGRDANHPMSYVLIIIGEGINKNTGEAIRFETYNR